MKTLFFCLLITAIIKHTAAVFSVTFQSQSLSSYSTLIDSVQYELDFTIPNEQINSGSQIRVSFSNKFNINSSSLVNCKATTSTSVPATAVTCSVTFKSGSQLYEVTMQGIYPTTAIHSFLSLKFEISNPYAQRTQSIIAYVYDSSDNLEGYGTAFVSYTASQLSSCSISTSTQITGQNSTHTFTFTPSQRVIANSQLQITMPFWYSTSSTSNLGSDSLVCTGIQNTDTSSLTCSIQDVDPDQIITVSGIVSSNKTVSGAVQLSIQSLRNPWSLQASGPVTFDIMVDGDLSQSCTDIYSSVTQLNTLKTIVFTIPTLTISTSNSNVRIIFISNNPFPKPDNRVKVTFSDSVDVSYSGSSTLLSQSSTQMVFSGITGISISSFTVITPPSTKPFSFTFTTQKVTSGVGYDIEQSTLSYQNTAGTISDVTVTPSSTVINEQTAYSISMTVQNDLVSGSFVQITVPSDLAIVISNTCSSTGHTCTINTANNVVIDLLSSISASSSLTVLINAVTNANEAKKTGTFTIQSFYDSGYDSLVDEVLTDITVTMTARQLSNSSVTPATLTTFQLTSYQFAFDLLDPIPAGGYFQITFPSTVIPQSPTLNSASFATASCSLTEPSAGTVRIQNCFSSQHNTLSVIITLGNLRNPPSLKPSDSFNIDTYGPSSLINFLDSGLTVTMTTPNTVQSTTITPTSTVVHESTTYTININHLITAHAVNDYVIVTFPTLLQVPDSPSCTATSGTISCSKLSTYSLKATYDTSPADTIEFALTNVNNYDLADYDVTFSLSIYDPEDYLMQMHNQYNLTFTQAAFTSVTTNNDDNIAVGQNSNVTLTINNGFTIHSALSSSLTRIQITIPAQFTIGATCTATAGTCSPISSTAYQVTNVGHTLTNFNVTLQSIIFNYFDPSSTTFKVVYSYNGYNISVLESGILVTVFCTSPCQRCDILATACESCLPAPNTFIFYDPVSLQCGTSCVSGKYADGINECQLCVSPCSTCLDSENCTSCVADTWLYEEDCVTICPDTYYNDSTGVCLSCVSPCDLCLTLSSCVSCATGFLTNNQCVDASSCPTGTFANTTTLQCETCTSPCAECNTEGTNCTSCVTNYLYISASHECVENCPDQMYPKNNELCFSCVSPCDNCVNQTYCSSCLSGQGYLSLGSCVDGADCPDGTYPDDTTFRCKSCPSGCTLCDNQTICTQCSSVYFFYEFQCLTSCPSGTYKESQTCQLCTSPCATCITTSINCLSCQSPKLYYQNQCFNSCPDQTYEDSGNCQSCLSTCQTCSDGSSCDTCSGSLYLSGSSCTSSCPSGSFADTVSNTCLTCTAPCSTCAASSTNCTACADPFVQFQNRCDSTTCPSNYFNVSGSCKTCSNCISCFNENTCLQCEPTFYEYNGICYTTCPTQAPIPDQATNTCGGCDSSCLSCQGSAKNCTSCYSTTYLFQGTCVGDCPTGFIEDITTGTCIEPLIGSVIYFPFSFMFLFFLIITIASKCKFSETQQITVLAAFISICEFGSWLLLTFILAVDYTLTTTIINAGMYLGIAVFSLSIGLGIIWNIVFCKQYQCDRGFQAWKEHDEVCVRTYRVITVFTCFTFRFWRLIYSKLFERFYFSDYIADGERLLTTINRLTFVSILVMTLPMMGISATFLYFKQNYDQTFFSSIDTLILGFLSMIFLTIDSAKDKDYFDGVKNSLPFLKYRNLGNEDSFIGDSLHGRLSDEDDEKNKRKTKSEVGQRERDAIFKKLTCIPDPNKFGHLNIIDPDEQQETKSLPQKLKNLLQYDPDNDDFHLDDNFGFIKNKKNLDGDRVIDDLYFEEQQKKRRQRQQQEQRERQRQRKREQERLKREEEERRKRQLQEKRRKLMEQDEEERVNLQFPDIVAIKKVQNKDQRNRRSPLQLLSNCKKVDDKAVDDKAMKKLQEMAKKNGLNKQFMKETFGVQKHHNPELLSKIIDRHNHVKRQSVKELFNENNNPEVLQELFGKNSKVDTQKLKEVLNDPNSVVLIQNLADKEKGRLSPQMTKQLFEKNNNFKPEFAKELLNEENGMDQKKLQALLKQNTGKGKESPLKALKKVGGEQLQNKEILNNMLGEDAVLKTENFTKVANELSVDALKNIFENKSKNSDIITEKLLNNKKINLKNIVPILEDEELIEDLANALGEGDQNLQENLINLFKNAQNIDPEKLKQTLNDPILRKKLLSNPVDPVFLEAILNKDSNTDMNLLKQTLQNMADEDIKQAFKFDPEKNVDFQNVAKIFDKNDKTDPKLVSKLLSPDMIKQLYVKGNDTKMFNKLVEKGNQFDADVIKGVYGKQRNHFFETQTDNLLNLQEEKKGDFHSQKDYSLGFQKNNKNLVNMSRTAGILKPMILPKFNSKNKMKAESDRQDDLNDEWRSDGDDSQAIDDDFQIIQESGEGGIRRKRKVKGKKAKHKVVDLRHPSEEIYLQRIEAPHEHAHKKASIRKNKKKIKEKEVMTLENDIFDQNF